MRHLEPTKAGLGPLAFPQLPSPRGHTSIPSSAPHHPAGPSPTAPETGPAGTAGQEAPLSSGPALAPSHLPAVHTVPSGPVSRRLNTLSSTMSCPPPSEKLSKQPTSATRAV